MKIRMRKTKAKRKMRARDRPLKNDFMTGSTLLAAEKTGRRAFLMEMDQLYCDVIVDRFQRYSGTAAVLERTGKSPIAMNPLEDDMR